jgi:hypothetical protein
MLFRLFQEDQNHVAFTSLHSFVACFGAAFWPNASGASDRGEVVNSPATMST